MESNLKSRAFAAYLGSDAKVLYPDVIDGKLDYEQCQWTEITNNNLSNIITSDNFPYCVIELIPLSEITDEDAIEVTRLADNDIEDGFIPNEKEKKTFINSLFDSIEIGILPYHIADYLRSKSYLLPFQGYDLLKEGIATLKTK